MSTERTHGQDLDSGEKKPGEGPLQVKRAHSDNCCPSEEAFRVTCGESTFSSAGHGSRPLAGHETQLSGGLAGSIALDPEPERQSRLIAALDMAGVGASTLCLIHCLAMPVVIALLPAFASSLFESEWFHVTLAFTVLVFCLAAYIPGYMRHHDIRLVWLGISGVGLVFFATFVARILWGEEAEIAIVTAGNLLLVAGHLLNRKLTSQLCCPGH